MYPKGLKWINSNWIPYFCKMSMHQDLQNTQYTTDFGYIPALGSLGKASGSAITGEMSRKQGHSTTRDYEECWTPSFER